MSKTYRRKTLNRSNRNLPSCDIISDIDLIINSQDEDDFYANHWAENSFDPEKRKKAALAYYHSESYSDNHTTRKFCYAKKKYSKIRRDAKKTLKEFIYGNDWSEFNDIIEHKPSDISWDIW